MKIDIAVEVTFSGDETRVLLGSLIVAREVLMHEGEYHKKFAAGSGVKYDHRQWLDENIKMLRRYLPAENV